MTTTSPAPVPRPVTVRHATPADAPALADLHVAVWRATHAAPEPLWRSEMVLVA